MIDKNPNLENLINSLDLISTVTNNPLRVSLKDSMYHYEYRIISHQGFDILP